MRKEVKVIEGTAKWIETEIAGYMEDGYSVNIVNITSTEDVDSTSHRIYAVIVELYKKEDKKK